MCVRVTDGGFSANGARTYLDHGGGRGYDAWRGGAAGAYYSGGGGGFPANGARTYPDHGGGRGYGAWRGSAAGAYSGGGGGGGGAVREPGTRELLGNPMSMATFNRLLTVRAHGGRLPSEAFANEDRV